MKNEQHKLNLALKNTSKTLLKFVLGDLKSENKIKTDN